jgi:pimeloyl-ACP methyl ester carboxylesterase
VGAGIALQIAIQRPHLVRKVVASVACNNDGFHPGLLAGLDTLKPEHLAGTPWQEEYLRIAPRREDFPKLVAKVTQLNMNIPNWPAEGVQSIKAPTLIIIADSDIVRAERAVEMFRLLGGDVPGDTPAGLPNPQLAILPGTSHVTVVDRADWLVSMIEAFLDREKAG